MSDLPHDLAQLLKDEDVSYRQIDYWVKQGWLKPEGGDGSGHFRRWSATEIKIARLMIRLIEFGITVPEAGKIARFAAESNAEYYILDKLGITLTVKTD